MTIKKSPIGCNENVFTGVASLGGVYRGKYLALEASAVLSHLDVDIAVLAMVMDGLPVRVKLAIRLASASLRTRVCYVRLRLDTLSRLSFLYEVEQCLLSNRELPHHAGSD